VSILPWGFEGRSVQTRQSSTTVVLSTTWHGSLPKGGAIGVATDDTLHEMYPTRHLSPPTFRQ